MDTGTATEPPVVLRVPESGAVELYADRARVGTGTVHFGLSGRRTIWTGPDTAADARVRGIPRLHLTGTGRLVAHAPVTWLAPTASVDAAANRPATPVTVAEPSWLDIPMR